MEHINIPKREDMALTSVSNLVRAGIIGQGEAAKTLFDRINKLSESQLIIYLLETSKMLNDVLDSDSFEVANLIAN